MYPDTILSHLSLNEFVHIIELLNNGYTFCIGTLVMLDFYFFLPWRQHEGHKGIL